MKIYSEDSGGCKNGTRAIRFFSGQEYQLNQAGITLVELIVTIAIMAVVMTTATLSFKSMLRKSKLESQVRGMYSDLADARNRAFTQKKVHGIVFSPNSYVMKSYSSAVEYKFPADAAANGITLLSKSLLYGITKTNTTTAFINDNSSILFDTTGFTTTATGFTVVVNPVTVSPALNCLVISAARVNMGKWNATTAKCEFN